jgi:hypothetical protein
VEHTRAFRALLTDLAAIISPPHVKALAGFVLLAALFYAPVLLGLGTFPPGDFTDHFLPFSYFQRSELLSGRLPLWNPFTYSGHPFLADVQAAVFYPLSNLLQLLSIPWGSIAARLYWLQLEAVVHVALAGFFTYLLLHDLTGRWVAAFAGGCAFAFSGYLTGYPPLQLAILRTAIWLPLLLWLLWRGFARPGSWHWWLAAALVYACAVFAGHPQTLLMLSYVVALWVVLLSVRASQASNGLACLWRLGPRVAFFYAATLALSAAQLWPSLELTRLSVRAAMDYAATSGGFPLQDTWQILLPGVLTLFSPLYVGAAGVGMALFAAGSIALGSGDTTLPSGKASVVFFLGVALFFLLASYGGNAFLYPVLYQLAPGWNLFRGQERAAYVVSFSLSVLVGYGLALWESALPDSRRRFSSAFAVLVVGAVALFALLLQWPGRTSVTWPQFAWRAGWALFVALCFFAISGRSLLQRWSAHIVVALLLIDLVVANADTNLTRASPMHRAALRPEIAALQALQAHEASLAGRVYNEYRVYEDYGMLAEVEDVWGSSPLRLDRYSQLFDGFPLERMWQLTGTQYVLTWRKELFVESTVLAEFAQESDTTYLHRLQQPNPRAWVVHSVQVVDDERASRLLADHDFGLDAVAVIAPTEAAIPCSEGLQAVLLAPGGEDTVSSTHLASNHLLLRVHSERGGLLVVSENWMPGWRAWLQTTDGSSKLLQVYRANLAFLGLRLPAGDQTIELLYWPDSVRYGFIVSTIAACGLVLLALWRLWRSERFRR